MKIGLIDVDGHRFPNLALMKLSAWHKAQGDSVEWWWGFGQYDRVYMAKVFDETYSPDVPEPLNATEIIKGGTGYGLDNKLPDEVEHSYPDYSIYPALTGYGKPLKEQTAFGFLTRGCPRGCKFCIVAHKEGRRSVKVADLSEFWRGQGNIVLMDPNLLACPDRMELLRQLQESKALVDINQGLDIRLTSKEVAEALNQIRVKRLHFAWDNPKDDLRKHFEDFARWYKRKSHDGKIVESRLANGAYLFYNNSYSVKGVALWQRSEISPDGRHRGMQSRDCQLRRSSYKCTIKLNMRVGTQRSLLRERR